MRGVAHTDDERIATLLREKGIPVEEVGGEETSNTGTSTPASDSIEQKLADALSALGTAKVELAEVIEAKSAAEVAGLNAMKLAEENATALREAQAAVSDARKIADEAVAARRIAEEQSEATRKDAARVLDDKKALEAELEALRNAKPKGAAKSGASTPATTGTQAQTTGG